MSNDERVSRRGLIAGIGAVAAGAALSGPSIAEHGDHKEKEAGRDHEAWHGKVDAWLAKQEITDLRRQYALATDLIGMNTKESVAQGRAIYRRIFTADAKIGATGQPRVTGPDAWVDIANSALKDYKDTQHLIGTQVVDLKSLPGADGKGADASMSSYLQAWHATKDDQVWLFIGTYYDKLTYTPENGWQIYDMELKQVSGDRRKITVT